MIRFNFYDCAAHLGIFLSVFSIGTFVSFVVFSLVLSLINGMN